MEFRRLASLHRRALSRSRRRRAAGGRSRRPLTGPKPGAYGQNDFGGFRNVLPPGENGLDNASTSAAVRGERHPPRAQRRPARRCTATCSTATRHCTTATSTSFFKDASFGVKPGDVESHLQPALRRDDRARPLRRAAHLRLRRAPAREFGHRLRDRRGPALLHRRLPPPRPRRAVVVRRRRPREPRARRRRSGTPRRTPRRTSSARSTRARRATSSSPTSCARTSRTTSRASTSTSPRRGSTREDARRVRGDRPARRGPADWKPTDIVATADVVGAIFGAGGGRELPSALVLEAMRGALRQDRPASRASGTTSATRTTPRRPRPCSGKRVPVRVAAASIRRGQRAARPGLGARPERAATRRADPPPGRPADAAGPALPELAFPTAMSNALLVSARRSASPGARSPSSARRSAYFAPQILMEQDVHAPGLDARGVAFPGTNLYVQLGRGRDYAWSATSAGQDITDTFARCRCCGRRHRTTSSAASACRSRSSSARTRGSRRAADSTPAGTETLTGRAHRLGIVTGARDDQGQAGASTRACAPPTGTRPTRGSASPTSTTRPGARRAQLPARGVA